VELKSSVIFKRQKGTGKGEEEATLT